MMQEAFDKWYYELNKNSEIHEERIASLEADLKLQATRLEEVGKSTLQTL